MKREELGQAAYLIFLGLLFLIVDIKIGEFDLFHDLVGVALSVLGVTRLSRANPELGAIPLVGLVLLVLVALVAVADLFGAEGSFIEWLNYSELLFLFTIAYMMWKSTMGIGATDLGRRWWLNLRLLGTVLVLSVVIALVIANTDVSSSVDIENIADFEFAGLAVLVLFSALFFLGVVVHTLILTYRTAALRHESS